MSSHALCWMVGANQLPATSEVRQSARWSSPQPTRKLLRGKQPSPDACPQQTQVGITPVSGPRNSRPQKPPSSWLKLLKSSLLCGNELCSLQAAVGASTLASAAPRADEALSKGITHIFLSGLPTNKQTRTFTLAKRMESCFRTNQNRCLFPLSATLEGEGGGGTLALYTVGAPFKMCGFTGLCGCPLLAQGPKKTATVAGVLVSLIR